MRNRPLSFLVPRVRMFTSSLHRALCHRGKDGLCFKGSAQRLLIPHDILMEFRSGLTPLRQWFLTFHNVFLFHNPKSSRKLHRVKPWAEPQFTFRLGSQVCQLWASLVAVSQLFSLSCCLDLWYLLVFLQEKRPSYLAEPSCGSQVYFNHVGGWEGSLIKQWWFLCSQNNLKPNTPVPGSKFPNPICSNH